MSAFYKIGEFAEKSGLSISTLRRWDKEGKLKPAKVTDGGTRLYSDYQLRTFNKPEVDRQIILAYSKDNQELLEQYLVANGFSFQIEPDLMKMVGLIESDKVFSVVFYQRSDMRLNDEIIPQSAFNFFKVICDLHGTVLDIVKKIGD